MKGELLILLSQVAWAVSGLFMKKFVQNTNPFLATSLIVLIGAILLSPILVYFSKEVKSFSSQKIILSILIAIFWIILGEILYLSGLNKISLSKASLLALTFPFYATLLGMIFLGEKIDLKFIFASLLMIAGYIFLVK